MIQETGKWQLYGLYRVGELEKLIARSVTCDHAKLDPFWER